MKNVIFLMVFMVMTATCCEKPGEPGQGGIVINPQSGLVVASDDATTKMNWADAKAYCENLTLNGYSDWYLPSWDEMCEIYDELKPVNITDPNPWDGKTYWVSSPIPPNTGYYMAWTNSNLGTPIQTISSGLLFVRPVRICD